MNKMNHIEPNKFSYLHNGSSIFFMKTDYFLEGFEYIRNLDSEITLITHNSDYSINQEILSLAPINIKKWFAVNCEVDDRRIEGIPIGLPNTIQCAIPEFGTVFDFALEMPGVLEREKDFTPEKLIYASFSTDTHASRHEVANICSKLDYVTNEISHNHNKMLEKCYTTFVRTLKNHKMVVCPRGNGVDTHRLWETLYAGRVPITKRTFALEFFESLPIIFLDDWEELRDVDHILKLYEETILNKRDMSMLDMSYWENKVNQS